MAKKSANIIPMSKYQGQPIEILQNDPQHIKWLLGQGWVRDEYPQFVALVINHFGEPSETPVPTESRHVPGIEICVRGL
jgi:hypothetical protein